MTEPTITIRDARTHADIEEIWRLGTGFDEFHASENVVEFWPKNILLDCLSQKNVLIKVAENDKAIVGFLIANINPVLRKAELENIYVELAYRKKGVGSALLHETIATLHRLGIANVVALQDEAVEFYEANGFVRGRQFYWMDLVLDDSFARNGGGK